MNTLEEDILFQKNGSNSFIDYLSKKLNESNTINKNIYDKINDLIDNIEELSKDIYMDDEYQNLKELNTKKIINAIGDKKLKDILKIDSRLQKEIDNFNKIPTTLVINFRKVNPDGQYYKNIKILDEEYDTSSKIELKSIDSKLKTYNKFEAQINVELINNEKKKIFN